MLLLLDRRRVMMYLLLDTVPVMANMCLRVGMVRRSIARRVRRLIVYGIGDSRCELLLGLRRISG